MREKKEMERVQKNTTIQELRDKGVLSGRVSNGLRRAGIGTVEDLIATTEVRLRGIRNFGPQSIAEVKKVLSDNGLSLAPEPTTMPETVAELYRRGDIGSRAYRACTGAGIYRMEEVIKIVNADALSMVPKLTPKCVRQIIDAVYKYHEEPISSISF